MYSFLKQNGERICIKITKIYIIGFFYYSQDKKVVEKTLPVSILASINMKVATTYCGSN